MSGSQPATCMRAETRANQRTLFARSLLARCLIGVKLSDRDQQGALVLIHCRLLHFSELFGGHKSLARQEPKLSGMVTESPPLTATELHSCDEVAAMQAGNLFGRMRRTRTSHCAGPSLVLAFLGLGLALGFSSSSSSTDPSRSTSFSSFTSDT